jgi:CelD/BcsL family acetyltransferase involved in cellulose biosynthesis
VSADRLEAEKCGRELQVQEIRGLDELDRATAAGWLVRAWDDLLARDPSGHFYMGPTWCLVWYRCYADAYDPLIIVVRDGTQLIGLIALAHERSTGRLVFAGDRMSDYRDILSLDDRRAAVVAAMLPKVLSAAGGHLFALGPSQPHSRTWQHVEEWARHFGFWTIVRRHPCWRLRLDLPNVLAGLNRRKTVRQGFRYYERAGGITFRRIVDPEEWQRLSGEFFTQHSMRQIYAGRPVTFTDPRKQVFYTQLFLAAPRESHFSCLWTAGRPIAFTFSFNWRGSLANGAPAVDILESKRPLGALHLAATARHGVETGEYQEVDLTIGDSAFKARFGTLQRQLATVYVYARPRQYFTARMRDGGIGLLKWTVGRVSSTADAWDEFKERLGRLQRLVERARAAGMTGIASGVVRRGARLLYTRYDACVYVVHPGRLTASSRDLTSEAAYVFKQDRIDDFLRLDGVPDEERTIHVRSAVGRLEAGHHLHTMLFKGRLAQLGWSHRAKEPPHIPETGSRLPVQAGGELLYEWFTVPDMRGRGLCVANLVCATRRLFDSGATAAYIVVERRNHAARRAIERVGFRLVSVHARMRILAWTRLHIRDVQSTDKVLRTEPLTPANSVQGPLELAARPPGHSDSL